MVEEELRNFSNIDIDMEAILAIIILLLIAYLIGMVISYILISFSERVLKYRIKIRMLLPLIKFSIYSFIIYYIIKNILEISSQDLVIFGGLLGAALGLGLKDLFADIIGGIVIIIEKPYHVGDKIKIGEYYGEVKDIGIRSTQIVTPDDDLVSAPNYLLFSQSVASANAGSTEMMVVIDVYLEHGCDLKIARNILREAVMTSRYVYISEDRPVIILVKDFPFYIRIRAKAYVLDLRYEFQFEADVTKRAWEELEKSGIKSPMVNIIDTAGTYKEKTKTD